MGVRVGIDLTSVDEVVEALRAHGDRYLRRVFTTREVNDCKDGDGVVDPQRLAARFAAKEAVLKALAAPPDVGLALTSVEVRQGQRGEPELMLAAQAADLARAAGVGALSLSLTHERDYAAAVVVAETRT